MQYKNLAIIGTSHISRDSIKEVQDSFERIKPGIVAVELDRKRLYALMHNIESKARFSDIRRIGLKGFLFVLVGGWLQKKLGQYVGVAPGSEMKAALQLAHECNAKVALIDQDIEITMQRFSRYFTWREKFRLIKDLFAAPFSKRESIDLSKVPEKKLVKKLLGEVKRKYPSVYRILVEERNEIMASNLIRIMQENPESRILAIVGAGHEDEILRIVSQKA